MAKVTKGGNPQGKRGSKGPSKYTTEFIEREADTLLDYARTTELIPFEYEFASMRGYHSQRLSEWVKINEKLSDALGRFKNMQKQISYLKSYVKQKMVKLNE